MHKEMYLTDTLASLRTSPGKPPEVPELPSNTDKSSRAEAIHLRHLEVI